MIGYVFSFSAIFKKIFFVTSRLLKDKAIKHGVCSLRQEFAPGGANSFHSELTYIEQGGGEKENSGVASPESLCMLCIVCHFASDFFFFF